MYRVHEWTSIDDIGKKFDAGVLTYSQYKKVEQAYIDCRIALMGEANVTGLTVCGPEYYDPEIQFPQFVCDEIEIRRIIMCCLQEKCWAKLEAENFYIHFGYDYYMYIGTELPLAMVEEIAVRYNLFCETVQSPYRFQDDCEDI